MDIKSSTLWCLVGIAAGGGLYGTYVKTMGKAAHTETQAYTMYGKCMMLRAKADSLSNHEKAKELIEEIKEKTPDIQKSDSVLALTTMAAGEKNNSLSGFAPLLKDCVSNLEREIKRSEAAQ